MHEVVANINMLGVAVHNGILCEQLSTTIVDEYGGQVRDILIEILQQLTKPMASLAASEDVTYSASVEDWETEDCNLEHQEMGPPASKKIEPEIEHW